MRTKRMLAVVLSAALGGLVSYGCGGQVSRRQLDSLLSPEATVVLTARTHSDKAILEKCTTLFQHTHTLSNGNKSLNAAMISVCVSSSS